MSGKIEKLSELTLLNLENDNISISIDKVKVVRVSL